MPELTIEGGIKLNYLDAGEATKPLLLLHGFPFNSALWRPQLPALGEPCRVIAPDFRGFGASQLSPRPYTMARLADDIAEILDALRIGQAAVAALSMGGYVAFELVKRHPQRVAALFLADTRPGPDTPEARANRDRMARTALQQGSRAVAEQLIPKLLAPETLAQKPELEDTLLDMMASASPQAIAAALSAMAERHDSTPHLSAIDVPVLVTGGTQDAITPPDEIEAWSRLIPDAKVQFIESAGHVPNMEQPDLFNAMLLDFLADAIGTPPRPEGSA
jgi:pimeloyl-ACP methyl ester carboxylesterase